MTEGELKYCYVKLLVSPTVQTSYYHTLRDLRDCIWWLLPAGSRMLRCTLQIFTFHCFSQYSSFYINHNSNLIREAVYLKSILNKQLQLKSLLSYRKLLFHHWKYTKRQYVMKVIYINANIQNYLCIFKAYENITRE